MRFAVVTGWAVAVVTFAALLLLGLDHPAARLAALSIVILGSMVLGMALEAAPTRKARP